MKSQIILRLLQRAAQRHALDLAESPVKLALEEAYTEMDQWFQQLVPDPELPPQLVAIRGRVSMYLLDAPQRWPNLFLAPDGKVPAAFESAVREMTVQSGPDLAVSSMVPRPLDCDPDPETAAESWVHSGRMSTVLVVGTVLALVGAAAFELMK